MKNILAAIDFSDVTEKLIEQAKRQAKNNQAKLWLVHVASPDPDFAGFEAGPQTVRDTRAKVLHKDREKLQKYAADIEGIETEALTIQGPISQTIIEQAKRLQADMIVIGSHGHGLLFHALIGSVCEGVLKHTDIPLLIIPERE